MSRLPDRQLLAPLIERAGGTAEVSLLLTSLYSEGFLDRRALEALYARSEVNRLVKEGQGRCRAMDEVAQQLCCSYEKVRAMIYENSKFGAARAEAACGLCRVANELKAANAD